MKNSKKKIIDYRVSSKFKNFQNFIVKGLETIFALKRFPWTPMIREQNVITCARAPTLLTIILILYTMLLTLFVFTYRV